MNNINEIVDDILNEASIKFLDANSEDTAEFYIRNKFAGHFYPTYYALFDLDDSLKEKLGGTVGIIIVEFDKRKLNPIKLYIESYDERDDQIGSYDKYVNGTLEDANKIMHELESKLSSNASHATLDAFGFTYDGIG